MFSLLNWGSRLSFSAFTIKTLWILCFRYQCKCWPGFHLKDDGKTCVDIDECSTTLPCSQRCINTYGSYKCLCVDGYEALERNPNTCKALSGQPDFYFYFFYIFQSEEFRRLPVSSICPLISCVPHFSWRAFPHNGRPPWDPETECRWLKLHHLETGNW